MSVSHHFLNRSKPLRGLECLPRQDRLYISEGSRCTEGLRVAPEELSETVAGFQLDTPRLAGAYVVCWTRGDASLALASGFSRESRDCVLGGSAEASCEEMLCKCNSSKSVESVMSVGHRIRFTLSDLFTWRRLGAGSHVTGLSSSYR